VAEIHDLPAEEEVRLRLARVRDAVAAVAGPIALVVLDAEHAQVQAVVEGLVELNAGLVSDLTEAQEELESIHAAPRGGDLGWVKRT
jgi:hypothetical protein